MSTYPASPYSTYSAGGSGSGGLTPGSASRSRSALGLGQPPLPHSQQPQQPQPQPPQPPVPRHLRNASLESDATGATDGGSGAGGIDGELEALERANFDLKMRLFYLEEKAAAGAQLPAQLYASLANANELQAALSRAEAEVDSKDALLLKARAAIETMASEVASARQVGEQARLAVQNDANERVAQAAQALQAQLQHAQSQVQDANARRLASEEEQAQLRLVLQQLEQNVTSSAAENARLLEHVRALTSEASERERRAAEAEARSQALEAQLADLGPNAAALHQAQSQVEDMKHDRAKLEQSQNRVHELALALQAAQAELERTQLESEHHRAAQEAHHAELLSTHEGRLREEHASVLRERDEAARQAFAELQDVYAQQASEAKSEHAKALEDARADFADREQQAAQRFEVELATKSRAFEIASAEMEETLRASFAREIDALKQEHALANERAANGQQHAQKDAEQTARIHALQLARVEERANEQAQKAAQHLSSVLAEHSVALLEAQSSASEELSSLRATHAAELAAAQQASQSAEQNHVAKDAALLANVEAQWKEREQTLRSEAAKQLETAQAELDFVRNNVVRVLRQQLDTVEAALQREHVPLARFDTLEREVAAAKEQVKDLRSRLADKSAELERLRAETVSVAKFHEVEDALERKERDNNDLRAALAQAQQQGRTHASSSPLAQHHTLSSNGGATSPVLHLSMYPAGTTAAAPSSSLPFGLSSPQPTARPTSSFHDFSALSSSHSSSPLAGATAMASSSTADASKASLRRLQAEHRLALSSLALARARVAELEQEHAEEGGAVVPRVALTEAQEELEALEARLARRDAQVQQMRDLLVVARFAPNEGNNNGNSAAAQLMRELGAQNGIHVAHTGSSSPPASPSAARRFAGDGTLSTADFGSSVLHIRSGSVASVSSVAGGQEQIYGAAVGSNELAAENARLTRALKARSAELAQLQLSLQKSKAALHALQENSVERSTHLELVASVDSAAKDASRAEERLVSTVAQARHFAEALQAEQHARAELQREAEEALRTQRASFEAELARAQEAVSAASSAAQNTSAEGAQAQQALRAAEVDKQRLEHVVTTIAAQLEQLEQTAASFDAGDDDSQQQQPRRLSDAGRTPSRLPATRGRGLFSPSRSSGANSGAGVALLGGVFGSPLPASSPFAAAFGASSSSLGASVTSTPAQPGGPGAAPLAVAAQVVSIAQSLDALHSSLSSWRERVMQLEEALQASEAQRAAEGAAAQGQLEGLRQQADAAVNDVSERLSRAEAAAHEAASTAASEHAGLERALQEAQQAVQASERQIDEAAREVLGLRQALQEQAERAETSLSAQRAADESRVRAEARAQEADSERAALIQTRLALTALQQAHEGCESAAALASDERRTLLLQLDHARSLEAEHALLSQRLAQAERRTQVVGADQHNVVQITRRVLVELCEVMHAAKIPQSSYTDAASVRTPSFLSGGTFHFPDDAEAAVKWLRGRAHELGRVRRAFEYTLIEVEAKWKANFAKMETLMHARQHEIATLQRRLLTALGQTESVTGTLRWK